MYFRQFLNDETACASYLFGCKTAGSSPSSTRMSNWSTTTSPPRILAGVQDRRGDRDPHPGRPRLGPPASSSSGQAPRPTCPNGSGVEFEHQAARGRRGRQARQHRDRGDRHARSRTGPPLRTWSPTTAAASEPWFVLTGDSLLVGDVGRPDLHAASEESVEETGADALPLAATSGSWRSPTTCWSTRPTTPVRSADADSRAHPASSIGFERRHNEALSAGSEDAFVEAALKDIPPAPEQQAEIVAANRSGEPVGRARLSGGGIELGLRREPRPVLARSSRSTPWSGRWSASSARPCR